MMEVGKTVKTEKPLKPFDTYQYQLEENSKNSKKAGKSTIGEKLTDWFPCKLVAKRVVYMVIKPETDNYQQL